MPKTPIPGVGWFATCQDTEGNTFGIIEEDRTAK
jgi:predicted enzyme related to lactoylglutathione lyase